MVAQTRCGTQRYANELIAISTSDALEHAISNNDALGHCRENAWFNLELVAPESSRRSLGFRGFLMHEHMRRTEKMFTCTGGIPRLPNNTTRGTQKRAKSGKLISHTGSPWKHAVIASFMISYAIKSLLKEV